MVLVELYLLSFLISVLYYLRLDRVRQLWVIRFAIWRLDVRDGHSAECSLLRPEVDRLRLDRYLLLLHELGRLGQAAAVDLQGAQRCHLGGWSAIDEVVFLGHQFVRMLLER
jgi:hypothetical protein